MFCCEIFDSGDHSSDHMAHNHIGKGYHYWSGPRDLKYFGINNSKPIIDFLRENGIDEQKLAEVEESMRVIKRMPFTNIWRVPGVFTQSDRVGVRRVVGIIFKKDLHRKLDFSVILGIQTTSTGMK